MREFIRFFTTFIIIIATCASYGVEAINPLSSYGQIQNVQTYSSNPFWNPNGGYRQNMPVPVYVTGPDVSSGDCERTVGTLIATICANNNNCHNMQLSDIRPSIMLQLSRLPGHNWATSCAGFIDTAFDNYTRSAEHTVVPTSFPGATTPNPTADGVKYQIQNPFVPNIPDWMREMKGREIELKQLQSQNSAGSESLARAEFPATYEDLSLAERWASATDGYKPYEDKSPYAPIKIADHVTQKTTSTTAPQGTAQNKDQKKTGKEETLNSVQCINLVEKTFKAYFDKNSWARVAKFNTMECEPADSETEYAELRKQINNIFKSNPQCNKHKLVSHTFKHYPDTVYYLELTISFTKSGDVYTVSDTKVKKCCGSSINPSPHCPQ
ncbi:MAG: hypothetical protein NC311_05065 [Muribaculaceae bacterium]|nr:hypothetical protein [Muribaculaceae bacterium]